MNAYVTQLGSFGRLLVLFCAISGVVCGRPIQACKKTGASYQADDSNVCLFYRCVFGILSGPFECAPGSGVPYGYFGSVNPCVLSVPNCKAPEKEKDKLEAYHGLQHYDKGKDTSPVKRRVGQFKTQFPSLFAAPVNDGEGREWGRSNLVPFPNKEEIAKVFKEGLILAENKRLNNQKLEENNKHHFDSRHNVATKGNDRRPRRHNVDAKINYFPRQYLQNLNGFPQHHKDGPPRGSLNHRPNANRNRREHRPHPRPRPPTSPRRGGKPRARNTHRFYDMRLAAKEYRPPVQKHNNHKPTQNHKKYVLSQRRTRPQYFLPLVTEKRKEFSRRKLPRNNRRRGSRDFDVQIKSDLRLKPEPKPSFSHFEPDLKKFKKFFVHNNDHSNKKFPQTAPAPFWSKDHRNQKFDPRQRQKKWPEQDKLELDQPPHRQDSVDQGVRFVDETEKEGPEGVLNTNSIWSDVVKTFKNQLGPPYLAADQVNATSWSRNAKEYTTREKKARLQKLAEHFPQSTRQEVFGPKTYKDLEDPNSKTRAETEATRRSSRSEPVSAPGRTSMQQQSQRREHALHFNEPHANTEEQEDDESPRNDESNETTLEDNELISEVLPDPGEVQIVTENVAGQVALIEQMVTYTNYHIRGGALIQIGIGEKECSELCMRNPYCLAFDYNKARAQCWFHSGDSYCGTLERREGCTHYKRIPCVPDKKNTFREIIYGLHVPGGLSLCSTCGLSHCLKMCAQMPDAICQAVDYNWEAKSCHMHRNSTACNTTVPRVTCAHYRRVTCGDDRPIMGYLALDDDSRSDPGPKETQLTHLLLQTFPMSPGLSIVSQPGLNLQALKAMGHFLVGVVQQQLGRDFILATTPPVDNTKGTRTERPTLHVGINWFSDNLGEQSPRQLPAVQLTDHITTRRKPCQNCKLPQSRPSKDNYIT